jgi:hypothetical protein
MNDDDFEWDAAKADANYEKHGLRFEVARWVFEDVFAIERPDARFDYGEDRFLIIGVVEGRILAVSYTLRDDKIRIISARGAEPHERRAYHEQNS